MEGCSFCCDCDCCDAKKLDENRQSKLVFCAKNTSNRDWS